MRASHVGKKVVAATALVCLVWLAVGVATIGYFHRLYEAHARGLAERLATIRATDAMQDVLWRLQATVLEVAERADTHTRIEVTELENSFEQHLARAASDSTTPETRALVESIRQQFSRYRDCVHRRLDGQDAPGAPFPAPLETACAAHAVAEPCQQLLEINQRRIDDLTAKRSQLRVSFDLMLLALWGTGPTVGILWGAWFFRGLSRSISQISISLTNAAGELEHDVGRVELHPSDDLPALQDQVQLVSSRIKQVMEQLEQARRETMRADRLAAVGELAAGVAHELRNPLTSVKLLVQTAALRSAERPLSEQQLHVVLEQIVRMENIIQGLLDFARPPVMHQVRHDLRDTLRRALNLVEGRARQQDVVIREVASPVPVPVDGDPEQLHQVFVNLLLNGIDAMPQGGELEVGIRSEGAPGGSQVTIGDTGSGISEAVMARMFQPFVTSKERGTGLGLAISHRIVMQHGGKLTAANQAVGGALFTVELPPCASRPDRNLRS
jgi:two-component system, NtrC family, sensor histidine kinase HydH